MIKIENVEVVGLDHAIRGMRNPMNSWDKSDSGTCTDYNNRGLCQQYEDCFKECPRMGYDEEEFILGPNDLDLANRLAKGGPVHAKYRRMMVVYLDITAPLYWWKEFDTYKVGTVANSCSTMHKIHDKEFELDDFSCEHLDIRTTKLLKDTIDMLNEYRHLYVDYDADDFEVKGCPSKKDIWWQMIQLLPSSYNQRRTIMMNYEVLVGMYRDRKNHKLDEWRELCKWIESLPYSEIITGEVKESEE